MIKILFIMLFAVAIFLCVYLSFIKNFGGATICAALAAVIAFTGPYIVEYVGNIDEKEETQNVEPVSDDRFSNHMHKSFSEEKENINNPTCLDAGSYELVSYCECGKELSREVVTAEALGHNYIATITEPSCEEIGFTTYTCSRCKDSYVGEQTDALGHDFVEEICSRCGTVSSEYEPLIISRANELVDIGKYDEAFNVVSEALDRVSSDSLQQLLSSIQGMQEKDSKYTAKNVEFITYSGSINSSDQTDTYSLDVPVTGYYRFDVSDMISGFSVKLQIYDSAGAKIGGGSGYSNGSGITCELVQGNTYTVKVISYSNTGSYTLTIGQQKETIDISTKEIVYDSIEYRDQENEYTFMPYTDGTYRFDFSDVVNGFTVKCYVYDSLGYKVVGGSGYGNGSGVTVDLSSDEVYTIKVIQYNNRGTYVLTLGKPQVPQDITGENSVYGEITYRDQKNIYIYTPSSTGEYVLTFRNMSSGFSVKAYVYDALGYKVVGGSGYGNDNKITAELNESETYTIHIIQYNNSGSYNLNISRESG